MTSVAIPADALTRAGFPADEAAEWAASSPVAGKQFPEAAADLSSYLVRGRDLLTRLPQRSQRSAAETSAWQALTTRLNAARGDFLLAHATTLYDTLTSRRTRWLRVEELVFTAAALVPGLVPTSSEMDTERARRLRDKEGREFEQALLVGSVLAVPPAGRHLVDAMLRPTPESVERVGELSSRGTIDLGPVQVTRQGRAGILELRNPRYLNAEDDQTLGPTECAVDMILLAPEIEIGVLRGGVVDRRGYQGERVFGAGLNLTRLYQGHLDFLFYLVRDLGFVNKIYRGLAEQDGGEPHSEHAEKLWIAAVERFAIGGACQLLHVVDHVIATRGSRLFLPARKEGIIPGASNLRLPRFVGERGARQAIMSGREWVAGEQDAAPLVDEVVDAPAMDRALHARIDALADSGLVNAVANRRVLRIGQEPVDLFREYMAAFTVEQARCHLSPALLRNLEVYWNAHERAG